jgi:antirepressor protein ant
MDTKVVTTINGVEILASKASEGLVPIKPICEALEIDYPTQFQKLKDHQIFGSTIGLSPTVAADGKEREMACLPIEFFPGWLFSINPANVKEESKENLIRFQLECNRVLFHYFFGSQKKRIERDSIEIKLLEELTELNQQKTMITSSIAEKKKLIEKLREERLKDEPRLFD